MKQGRLKSSFTDELRELQMQFQRVAQIQAQLDSLLFNRSAEQSEIHTKLSEVNARGSSATRWERPSRSNVITTNAYRRTRRRTAPNENANYLETV